MKKKVISILLALCTSIIGAVSVNVGEAQAATLNSNKVGEYVLGRVGQSYPDRRCLQFVEECYQNLGGSRPHDCCSSKSGNVYLKSSDSNNIPVGATVYFTNCGGGPCGSCGSRYYGHVGIYVGNGYFVHATGGKVQKSTLASWKNKYRGWGYCGNNTVSGNMPKNPTISKSQIWYDLKDRIEIKAYADEATDYYMSMFKDGNKIISQNVDGGTFNLDASTYGTGEYSAYFSCYNSAGSIDTKWIEFAVVGPAVYSNVYTSNEWYDLTDTVSISVDTICAKGQVIGIDKEGVGRVVTESTDSTYKTAASKLGVGKYSAYFSVWNGSGGVDTKRVSFEIVDKPKKDAKVSVSKTSYALNEEVEISVLVSCSKEEWIGIDKIGTGRVVTEKANNGKFNIAASKLGEGNYSAYFSVANGSGGYDTSRVEFSIR